LVCKMPLVGLIPFLPITGLSVEEAAKKVLMPLVGLIPFLLYSKSS